MITRRIAGGNGGMKHHAPSNAASSSPHTERYKSTPPTASPNSLLDKGARGHPRPGHTPPMFIDTAVNRRPQGNHGGGPLGQGGPPSSRTALDRASQQHEQHCKHGMYQWYQPDPPRQHAHNRHPSSSEMTGDVRSQCSKVYPWRSDDDIPRPIMTDGDDSAHRWTFGPLGGGVRVSIHGSG